MSLPAPKIDERTYNDLVQTTETLLNRYSEWKPSNEEDGLGRALVRVFSHFSKLVIDRLNQVPEKNFLAFLELTGVDLLPPRPARVPLTFELAEGASDENAIIPARTSVAAAENGTDSEPVRFETERGLFLTRSRLIAAWTIDPGNAIGIDNSATFSDQSTIASGQTNDVVFAFGAQGGSEQDQSSWLERSQTSQYFELFFGHRELIGLDATKTIVLQLGLDDPQPTWLKDIEWHVWNGQDWGQGVTGLISPTNDVELRNVPPVPDRDIHGHSNAWLRARLKRAGPQDQGQRQRIRLTSADVQVRGAKSGISTPDLVFANQSSVDATKDFLPFGERPRVGDTLYLASDEIFFKPKAAVQLTIQPTSPRTDNGEEPRTEPTPAQPSEDLTLVWEHWNPGTKSWQTLAARDATDRLSKVGTVRFNVPQEIGAVDVNGEIRYWIRVRIDSGNYGVESRLEVEVDEQGQVKKDENGIPILRQVPPNAQPVRPPSIKSVRISYSNYGSQFRPLEKVLAEHDLVMDDIAFARAEIREFRPFETDTKPTFYLGFQREDPHAGFAQLPVALFFRVVEDQAESPSQLSGETPLIVWEYWNGTDWANLDVQDETDRLRQRGLVTFIGPTDLRATSRFAGQPGTFWLRIRWEAGDYASPVKLRRVMTNTMWAAHLETIENEILGSGTGEPQLVLQTAKAPILGDVRIEIREPITRRQDEEEGVSAPPRDVLSQRVEDWISWEHVPDFVQSGRTSRHYTLDRLTGEIRFGDGRRGMLPPRGGDNIRASRYRIGGGQHGNRLAETITQLRTTIPYVGGVTNFEASTGGANAEDLESVKRRGPRTLRHRNRAVAESDYADLALEVVGVARAKSIAVSSRAGQPGRVRLIVVAESDAARPFPSADLIGQVKRYLARSMPPAAELTVVGPTWLPLEMEVVLVPQSLDDVHQLRKELQTRLTAFLHPLTGGTDDQGWPFGHIPRTSELYSVVEQVPGVREVLKVKRPDTDNLPDDPFLVVSAEQHKIKIQLPD